ncbi:TrmH family RNA methyltransferase [Carboxylicivirga marina]|uniref:RNA methyltransferase n=1 Tax=Carboxylicivirga marina TaxID=2800988 RepID=A0ABS1HHT1_9BACT|nr:RNA methyltransferase [Carboxylicivirga marina]MBK3517141.1 RNA methyltransferase [Carboxylicivirga marina]
MLSKNKQKFILSLSRKKVREQNEVFVAEGHKLVSDLLSAGCDVDTIIATDSWLNENKTLTNNCHEIIDSSTDELKKVSQLKSPPSVIAVFNQNKKPLNIEHLKTQLSIFLDEIQDPGNLGTIIRLADWFGIKNIICSKNCADVYNAKTIQSTMGAISRVNVHYVDTLAFFQDFQNLKLPIYGTFLDGDNIYEESLTSNGLIVMGNEGKGISTEVERHISSRLLIPPYPDNASTSESLNVSVATAIICAEFRRTKN